MANGYHKIFDEWVEKDLTNLIRHYRNNPSIVMWCIGNEVPDQWNGNNGPKLSRMLQDICHREDPTRPVTQGTVTNTHRADIRELRGFMRIVFQRCAQALFSSFLPIRKLQ